MRGLQKGWTEGPSDESDRRRCPTENLRALTLDQTFDGELIFDVIFAIRNHLKGHFAKLFFLEGSVGQSLVQDIFVRQCLHAIWVVFFQHCWYDKTTG